MFLCVNCDHVYDDVELDPWQASPTCKGCATVERAFYEGKSYVKPEENLPDEYYDWLAEKDGCLE